MPDTRPVKLAIKSPPLLPSWRSLPQTVRYLVVGLFNTAVGYGVFGFFLVTLSDVLPYFGVLVLSHITAVTVSFLTHRRLVFEGAAGQFWTEYARFQGSYLWLVPQSLLINMGLVFYLAFTPWAAQAITIVVGVGTAYFVHRVIVFKGRL